MTEPSANLRSNSPDSFLASIRIRARKTQSLSPHKVRGDYNTCAADYGAFAADSSAYTADYSACAADYGACAADYSACAAEYGACAANIAPVQHM